MKHTSVRLSDEHAAKIEQTGESPTVIIKKALDLYFEIPSKDLEPARKLIEEHVRTYHMNKHIVSTTQTASKSAPYNVPQDVLKPVPIVAHMVSTEARTALSFILEELKAGLEPTIGEIAAKSNMTPQTLAKILSPCGIRSNVTTRSGRSARIYTLGMKAQIEEILAKV